MEMKTKAAALTVVFLVLSQIPAFAQSSTEEACWLANKQAEKEAIQSTMLWMGFGCLTGPVAVFMSFNDDPKPNMSLVAGKPSNYVGRYVKCYKDAMKTGSIAGSIGGCTLMGLGVLVIVFAGPYIF